MSRPPMPPRFVPTLTEVIRPMSVPAAPTAPPPAPLNASETSVTAAPLPPASSPAPSADIQEQMVQRVLQRVDLMLDRRLREVVGQLILEHTQSLAPRLREEIEDVVRQSVSQAFASESTPPAAGG